MGHLRRWHVCTLRDVSTFQKLIMGQQNRHACKTHHWTARPVGLQSLVHTLGIKTCHYLKRINAIVVIRTCLVSDSCGGEVIWPQHHLSICLSVLGVYSAHFDQRCHHKVPLLVVPLLFFVHQEKKKCPSLKPSQSLSNVHSCTDAQSQNSKKLSNLKAFKNSSSSKILPDLNSFISKLWHCWTWVSL